MRIGKVVMILFLCVGVIGSTQILISARDKTVIKNDSIDNKEIVEMKTITIKEVTWYLVESEEQLRAIGAGQYGLDKNYMQNADIVMSKKEWIPIGTEKKAFTGQYNGNGFEIKRLTMKSSTAMLVGFFGYAKGANLYNITLKKLDIETAGAPGKSVGAICARANKCNIYSNYVESIYD